MIGRPEWHFWEFLSWLGGVATLFVRQKMFSVVSRPLARTVLARSVGTLRGPAGRGIVSLAIHGKAFDAVAVGSLRNVHAGSTIAGLTRTSIFLDKRWSTTQAPAESTIPSPPPKPAPIPKKSSSRAPRSAASRLRRRLAYLLAFLAASYIAYETVPPARHLLIALIRCTRLLTAVTANIIDYKWMFAKHYDPAVYTEEEIKEFRRGGRRECHKRSAGRLFEALKRNAGIYVKLGQHIASIQALPKE